MRGGARALNLSRGPARVHITHGGPGPFARKNRDCCRFIPDIYLIGPGFYVSDCARTPAPGGAVAAKAVCFRAECPDATARTHVTPAPRPEQNGGI
ncbi:hypothetical protein EVAR_59936_1 [Eumeta japonica]|uniref:Uncharacterized protein n=1 Tax=Eumeta variegata TaxID=151549 RepID=A0A4C1ZC64_EUMVA|nr:hypothetical protein EVAR_59936_1 [Eumeta japonica]